MPFEPKKILKQFWGYDTFREPQLAIIESALRGKDTLALLPTGGGKSICFQVPALCQEGICIVVTPLIALMKDQVYHLKRRGVKALTIHSGMSPREIDIALDNAAYGDYKFLYVSPERLKTDLFKERIKKMTVNLLAVDEAHCISQWGYDFRPAYLEIAQFRELLPKVPVLALTATATPRVVGDIQKQLQFQQEHVIRKSFSRPNLRYFVINTEQKVETIMSVIRKQKGSGIIYVRSRALTAEYANMLRNQGVSADFYHAGLDFDDRERRQMDWMQNKFQVICCTNAFGMGIDKPDVRFVINVDLPESLEAYFQEAGRGGRDGKKSFAVLLVNAKDKGQLFDRIHQKFPDIEVVQRVYGLINNHLRLAIGSGALETFSIDWSKLKDQGTFSLNEIVQSAALIERAGYWIVSEGARSTSTLKVIQNQRDVYAVQVRYPQYDEVLKVLLRGHSGLFEGYVKIVESELAKRIEKPVAKVKQVLRELHRLEVIEYNENLSPQTITYVQPRVDMKNLRIPTKFYQDLKKVAVSNADAIVEYAFSEHQCRSRLLLAYFGETDSENCGTCDYCVSQKQTELSSSEINVLKENILELLHNQGGMEGREIVKRMVSTHKRDNVNFVLQWMLDNGIVLVNDSLNFERI